MSTQKKQIQIIEKIIGLLPKLSVHTSTPELKEAYKKLQRHIKEWELESVFNQPMSEEERKERERVHKLVEKFRKGDKKIEL